MNINLKKVIILLCMIFIFFTDSLARKYTLLVEPAYPSYQTKEVYQPLKQWLMDRTGFDVEIIVDHSYHFYWINAQKEEGPDFTFDAPHVALYRKLNKKYTPLATTKEPLEFHLVSLNKPEEGESLDEFLSFKDVVMLGRPSIATELFHQWFTDTFFVPKKNVRALSWLDAVETIFGGAAEAAIVPGRLKEIYPNLYSLKKSKKMQGLTFMVSSEVPQKDVNIFKAAIMAMYDDPDAHDALLELNTVGFKPVNSTEFNNIKSEFPYIFNQSKKKKRNTQLINRGARVQNGL